MIQHLKLIKNDWTHPFLFWLVVWNIFYFSIYWEELSQLTNIFQKGLKPPTSFFLVNPYWIWAVSMHLKLSAVRDWAVSIMILTDSRRFDVGRARLTAHTFL
jgi:hypothetical protein